jgi:cephalosporin hydroxylase|eukprot:449636-Prymnesium_polylepis.1
MSLFGLQFELFPLDAIIIAELLYETKPAAILETDSHKGGSAMFYSLVMEHINPDCKIVSVDIAPSVAPELKPGGRLHALGSRIQFFTGDAVGPSVLAAMKSATEGAATVFVSLDSNHGKAHVLKELHAYAPFVPVGSYLLVQDTRLGRDWHTTGHKGAKAYVTEMWKHHAGPLDAVNEFLAGAGRNTFARVPNAERLLISNSGGGWLKRVAADNGPKLQI